MGLFSYDQFQRSVLLVCDDCERVHQEDGRLSEMTLRESSPDELVPHFGDRDEVIGRANNSGWEVTRERGAVRERWTCPECVGRRSRP